MVTPEFQERMHLILQSDYSEENREAIDDMMQEVNEWKERYLYAVFV